MAEVNRFGKTARRRRDTWNQLHQKLRQLAEARGRIRNKPRVTVGIHGVPDAAKTAFLLGLYTTAVYL